MFHLTEEKKINRKKDVSLFDVFCCALAEQISINNIIGVKHDT